MQSYILGLPSGFLGVFSPLILLLKTSSSKDLIGLPSSTLILVNLPVSSSGGKLLLVFKVIWNILAGKIEIPHQLLSARLPNV